MPKIPRNLSLDAVKGIAVLLVACGHYVPESAPLSWRNFVDFIHTFHMDVFFILSGWLYVSGRSPKDFGELRLFFGKKMQRLMGPFMCIAALFFIIKIAAQQFFPMTTPVTPETVLRLFTSPRQSFTGLLWFLEILFLNFVLFSGVALLMGKRMLACLLLLLPCLSTVAQPALALLLFYLPSFAVGTLLPFSLQGREGRIRALSFGGLFLGMTCWLPLGPWEHIVRGLAAVLLPLALFHILPALFTRLWAVLGLYGTSVYLFHFPFVSAVKKVVDKWQIPHEFFSLSACVAISLGIVCPILIEQLCLSRNPRLLLWFTGEKPLDKRALLRTASV